MNDFSITLYLNIVAFLLLMTGPVAWANADIYHFSEIDYFSEYTQQHVLNTSINAVNDPVVESSWGEPLITSDGTLHNYKPPQIVVDFLEVPTQENALKYLRWNQQRIDKILKAQSVLDTMGREAEDRAEKQL
jgi:hypothetical protein